MPSIDSVNKTNAVRSVPGGVLGAEDGGGGGECRRQSPCPVRLLRYWQRPPGAGGRREVKYQVCQMAPSTIEKNEAEKGFAIINRVKREAFTERWHLEWRPQAGLRFPVNNYSSVCVV